MMDQEYVMLAEEDYNEMLLDIDYLKAALILCTDAMREHGVDVVITEEEIWERVKQGVDDE